MIKFPSLGEHERRVPEAHVTDLLAAIEKLSKRAAKLGVALPEIREVRVEDLQVLDERGNPTGEMARFRIYDAERRLVHLPGWSLAAVVQHTSEGNILRSVPSLDQELPAIYRTDAPTCDHCGKVRRRAETFVLRHEDARFTRVGRQCLGDFLGRESADRIVMLAGIAESIDAAFSEFDGESYGGASRYYPAGIAAMTVAAIAANGWLSRGQAKIRGGMATADDILVHLNPPPKFRKTIPAATDEQIAEAGAALVWARELDPESSSDYLHNCRVIAHLGSWSHREMGIGCSIVAAYQREQSRLKLMEFARRLPSVWLGDLGARFGGKGTKKNPAPVPLDVVVIRTYEMSGDFGLTTIVTMQTQVDESHVADLVWFASGSVDVEAGDRATLTGTVKRHVTDKKTSRPETHLTRCTLVKVEAGDAAQDELCPLA